MYTQEPKPPVNDEFSEVNQASQALVDALKRLAQAKIDSATDLTEATHQNIEHTVQEMRDKADRQWRMASDRIEDIDDRLINAAKAAWEIITAPPTDRN
jgi:methyl-accepting chemotaxis protein